MDELALTQLGLDELIKKTGNPDNAIVLVVNGDTFEPYTLPINKLFTQTTSDDDDYPWDDIIQPLMGKRLDTSSGKLDYDWANKGISFADSTLISNDTHKVHFGYQIYHRFKLDGKCNPHIHWIQKQAAMPNWWIRWRIWRNGEAAGDWNSDTLTDNMFTYSSGTILQISQIGTMIDFSTAVSGGLNVSDFLDIEITRDTDNASSLFSGNDPVSGSVTVKGFDPHLQIDSRGSATEFVK